jgi:hypothetical protein
LYRPIFLPISSAAAGTGSSPVEDAFRGPVIVVSALVFSGLLFVPSGSKLDLLLREICPAIVGLSGIIYFTGRASAGADGK